MTYVSPTLSLIGNATGIVLSKVGFPNGMWDGVRPSGLAYDATALLETDW